ncbi:MAG: winged helix-turn-helix transcriptional regulator [Clostridia bacterium]|nr:winged helix-turn-helix transcriptional regulator [Clostridia bacterium]
MDLEYGCDCNVIHPELVEEISSNMPSSIALDRLADFFAIIGDSTRCRILFSISQHEMCVCDIANVLNMTKSSVSHHLAKLRAAGVVKSIKIGREVRYSLNDSHVSLIYNLGLEHINHTGENHD